MKYNLRWLVKTDFPHAKEIEKASFVDNRNRLLHQANVNQNIIMVAESPIKGSPIVGFMIYDVHSDGYQVLSLAVDPKYRRSKIGTAFHKRLQERLFQSQRTWISIDVNETNLEAQLFFKEMGYRAVRISNTIPPSRTTYTMEYRREAS